MPKTTAILFAIFCYSAAFSQSKPDKIKVFLDCSQTWICNYDYTRTEMPMVVFVRDRFDGDVHILINTQSNNNGGTQAQLFFIGQKAFQNSSDTLTFFNDPTSTEDEQRKKLVQYLKLGLTRYIAKSKAAENLTITYPQTDSAKNAASATVRDKWNYWVFQLTTFGSFSGTENYKNSSLNGSFSANRETQKWKMGAQFSVNKSVDFYIDSAGKTKFTRQGLDGSIDMAKKINNHWAYGLEAAYTNSLYSNIKASYKVRPKIEYSFYPYPKFNTQRIVLQYVIGPAYMKYYDTTLYLKTKELQYLQSVNMIASFTKPWGSVNMGIFYNGFMEDLTKNSLTFNGAVSWKIVKGLNFAVWGNYGLIHDQIALRKGNASRDELLVRNRELRSSYNYNLGVAFTYRFGSILNNIINPVFRGLNYSINF
jgi:hypothetical protein